MAKDEKKVNAETKEEIVEEVAVEYVAPPTVDTLMVEVMTTMPTMQAKSASVKILMTLLSTYVGTEDIPVIEMSSADALMELSVINGWEATFIQKALDDVMEGIADQLSKTSDEFADMTGTFVDDPTGFNAYKDRYSAELQEHDQLVGLANHLLTLVKNVAGALGIPNPDPALQKEVAENKAKKVLATIAQGVEAGLKAGAEVFVKPATSENDLENLVESPSWMTNPDIDDDDKNVKILELINNRLSSKADVAQVQDALKRINLDTPEITAVLVSVSTLARKQLDTSKQVITNVKADFSQIEQSLASAQNLRKVVQQVHKFFFT